MPTNLLFLYTEISGYFMACAETLAQLSGAKVTVIRWEVNQEAPFQFHPQEGISLLNRNDFTDETLTAFCNDLKPACVYVAGRLDKGYLAVAKQLKKKGIPVLFGFDNHWTGSWRQQVASWLSPFMIQNRFTHAWIPGTPQYSFAEKLGFANDKILTGVYAGNIAPFLAAGAACVDSKKSNYPHTLLFCGRLVGAKGILELLQAFRALTPSQRGDWKLMLAGTGPIEINVSSGEPIELLGFIQPEKLPELVAQSGAFILPSQFEPWGVALHEFAAGGLPLIASSAVGAATSFLYEGKNGWTFPAGDTNKLKEVLATLFAAPDEKLAEMGKASRVLSLQISPETWAQTIMKLID
jgi:glycosyltransferase involved in cell wall biosynthesis